MERTNNNATLQNLMAQASPEAQVAMVALDDSQKSRKSASKARCSAQQDRMQKMRESAGKLRELASKALHSSLYQCFLGVSAACAKMGGQNGVASLFEATAKVDPFMIASKRVEHEKAKIDIQAEAASHRAGSAADDLDHAKRMHSSAMGSLKQIEEAKHRAALEASKI